MRSAAESGLEVRLPPAVAVAVATVAVGYYATGTSFAHTNALATNCGCAAAVVRLCLLTASYNEIKELPVEIQELAYVTSFKIRHNQLRHLPESFWDLTKLTSLDLSKYVALSGFFRSTMAMR